MFKIEVTTLDRRVLFALAKMFADLAEQQQPEPVTMSATQYLASVGLSPEDNPATGAMTAANTFATARKESAETATQSISVAQIFEAVNAEKTGLDPARVFGGSASPNAAPPAPTAQVAGNVSYQQPATHQAENVTAIASHTAGVPTVELDRDGMPWDARIHSGGRTKVKDGTWTKKKNVDPVVYAQISAEIKQAMAAPAVVFTPLNALNTGQTAPLPPGVSSQTAVVSPSEAPPVPATTVYDFKTLMQWVTSRAIPQPQIFAACNKYGVPSLGLVATRPDLVLPIYHELGGA